MKYSPGYFLLCIVVTAITGLMSPIMLFVEAKFIDAAITILSSSSQLQEMIIYLILMGICYLYLQYNQDFNQYIYDLLEDSLRRKMKPDIIKKIYAIDYLTYEMADTQNLLVRATDPPHEL